MYLNILFCFIYNSRLLFCVLLFAFCFWLLALLLFGFFKSMENKYKMKNGNIHTHKSGVIFVFYFLCKLSGGSSHFIISLDDHIGQMLSTLRSTFQSMTQSRPPSLRGLHSKGECPFHSLSTPI